MPRVTITTSGSREPLAITVIQQTVDTYVAQLADPNAVLTIRVSGGTRYIPVRQVVYLYVEDEASSEASDLNDIGIRNPLTGEDETYQLRDPLP